MASTFRCKIVTPAESAFDGEVSYASFPAWDGQQGVLSGQSPLLTQLGVGRLRLTRADGGSTMLLVDGGFAQVQGNVLTILTEHTWRADELSVAEAEKELAEANAHAVAGGADRAVVEADQQRARAKRALAAAGSA